MLTHPRVVHGTSDGDSLLIGYGRGSHVPAERVLTREDVFITARSCIMRSCEIHEQTLIGVAVLKRHVHGVLQVALLCLG